ncbi:hypothetical protein [Blautia marasmi]|uniref:hypothetical protein n=1 Tax=Blautia marasmi TaxID=1917868 RepID=UPI000CF26E3D|nr:hypothetical protein [Blautia marasmi]
MKDKDFQRAQELKREIERLDSEIYLLYDFMPPTNRNWVTKLLYKVKRLIMINSFYAVTREIELTNDDVRALQDLRIAKQDQLKTEFECIGCN